MEGEEMEGEEMEGVEMEGVEMEGVENGGVSTDTELAKKRRVSQRLIVFYVTTKLPH